MRYLAIYQKLKHNLAVHLTARSSRPVTAVVMHSIMKNFSNFIILISIYLAGCSTYHEKRLIGHWISDKERTLKEFNPKIQENQRFLFQISLGGIRISYNDNTIELNYRGDVYKQTYEVIEKSNESITIKIYNEKSTEGFIQQIYFGLNSYWRKSDLRNFYEYFKKSNTRAKPAKYSKSEVKKIADSYAEEWGFILNEYETPKIKYNPEKLLWYLFYDGKPISYTELGEPLYMMGNDFTVYIDSFTKEAWIYTGR